MTKQESTEQEPRAEPTEGVAASDSASQPAVDAIKQIFTSGSETPASGKIEADEHSRYLAEMAAYKAVQKRAAALADKIVEKLSDTHEPRILVVDSEEVAGEDLLLRQTTAELSDWKELFQSEIDAVRNAIVAGQPQRRERALATAAAGHGIGAALVGLVGLAPEIAKLLRTDLSLKGRAIANPVHKALQRAVAGRISNARVFLPNMRRIGNCPLLDQYLGVEKQHRTLNAELRTLEAQVVLPIKNEIKQLSQQLEAVDDSDAAQKQDLELAMTAAEDRLALPQARLDSGLATGKAYSDYASALLAAPDEGGLPALQRAMARSDIDNSQITHLLHVEIVSMGGVEAIAKHWTTFGRPTLHYVGACVCDYVLATVDGEVLLSDTLTGDARLCFRVEHGQPGLFHSA